MLIDHALLVAQSLDKLTGGSSWAHRLVSAIASLHDLLASTYQGHTISKNKLIGDNRYIKGTGRSVEEIRYGKYRAILSKTFQRSSYNTLIGHVGAIGGNCYEVVKYYRTSNY